MDDGSFSKDDDQRLLRSLREAALNDFPNPERVGCPGDEFLRKVAADRKSVPLNDKRWQHLVRCSPCFREYTAFQESATKNQLLRRSALAAAIVVAVIGSWLMWRVVPSKNLGEQTYIAASLDLKDRSLIRGAAGPVPGPKPDSLSLPRRKVALTIILPLASEPGDYEVQVLQDVNKPLLSTVGKSEFAGGLTTMRVSLNLSPLASGRYLVALRRAGSEWTYYTVVIS